MYNGLDPFGYFFEDFVSKPTTNSLVAVDKENRVVLLFEYSYFPS